MIIETQHSHKVELREELPVRDHLAMKKKALMLNVNEGNAAKNPDGAIELEEFLMRLYVTSFDGVRESAYEKMMETLTGSEYEQVNKGIGSIVTQLGKE